MFTELTKKRKNILKIAIAIILAIAICFTIPVHIEQYYCSQMLKAIEKNDMEKLRSAMEKGNPNSVLGIQWLEQFFIEWSRRTPLQEACRIGTFEMVKLLVEGGADVNYYPVNSEASALYFAARSEWPGSLDKVRYLIKNGAVAVYPNPVDYLFGDTDFTSDGVELLRELAAVGYEIDDDHLREACIRKYDEIIRFFVEECGCDASNPEVLRAYCNNWEADYSYETFEYFLERGANPYADVGNGKCAMDYLRKKSPEWAEKLEMLAKEYGFEE